MKWVGGQRVVGSGVLSGVEPYLLEIKMILTLYSLLLVGVYQLTREWTVGPGSTPSPWIFSDFSVLMVPK